MIRDFFSKIGKRCRGATDEASRDSLSDPIGDGGSIILYFSTFFLFPIDKSKIMWYDVTVLIQFIQ